MLVYCLGLLSALIYENIKLVKGSGLPKEVHIPFDAAQYCMLTIFWYFIYKVKIVHTKLESVNFQVFMATIKRTRVLFVMLFFLCILRFCLFILFTYVPVFVDDNGQFTVDGIVIRILDTILTIV